MSEIFLYTKDAEIPSAQLEALKRAGYVPVKVATLDQVKIMSKPSPIAQADMDLITHAMALAIAEHSNHGGVQNTFGQKLSKLIAQATAPTPRTAR